MATPLQNILAFTVLAFSLGFKSELEAAKIVYVPWSFSTIQAAIDSVPSNSNNWIVIDIKAGIYNEQVKIPSDKPFIHLKGVYGKTSIVWGAIDSIFDSTIFDSLADNILVTGINFLNSYNYPLRNSGNPAKIALAARIAGDKSALYDCSFSGFQDTLYDYDGRHYFKRCNITGGVDFIFGNGRSLYEDCTISVDPDSQLDDNFVGYITAAQGRENPNDNTGFVFKNCNVIGNAKVYLGRAWRPFSRVIFYNSFLSDIILPQGWDSWNNDVYKLTFVEEQCRGLGSDKSSRVKWEKTLGQGELQYLTSISYIDNEGWLSKLPSY